MVAIVALAALGMPLPAAAQSDETCIAYLEADANYEAALTKAQAEHISAIRAAWREFHVVERAASARSNAAWREAKASEDKTKATLTYHATMSKAGDARQAAVRAADARLGAALWPAEKAWTLAYVDAYEGPTNDARVVYGKLVAADRGRCRQRGM